MSSEVSLAVTILPALIGAVSGSFGGNLISDYLRKRSERESIRKNIIDKYLIQLQDATESLWFRFQNIKDRGGRLVMSDKYYEHSTLYALASVLAYNRIMLLDGIYSQIQELVPNLDNLRRKLGELERAMDTGSIASLYRYDRLSLAEAVLEVENERMRVCSYLNFKERYEDLNANLKTFLLPAKDFVESLEDRDIELLMSRLKQITQMLPQGTSIASAVK